MVIDGGIVGAKVSCRGNLKVRFIHSSQISAGGDIIVERELINSEIETNGALVALPAGEIFTSQVMAEKGIAANQIGSSTSKPCTLTVGMDAGSKSIMEKKQKEISLPEEEKKKLEISLERLTQAMERLKEDLVKNTQTRDQAVLELSRHKKWTEELQEKKDSSRLAQAEKERKKLEDQVRKSEESLKKNQGTTRPDLRGRLFSSSSNRREGNAPPRASSTDGKNPAR